MTKATICLAMLIIITGSAAPHIAEAAVSKSRQRAAEINAVVEAVSRKMPQHPINTVMYIRSNNFEVLAGTCTVRAHIVTSKKASSGNTSKVKVRLNRQRCTR